MKVVGVCLLVLLITNLVLATSCVPDPFGAAQAYNLYASGNVFGCNSDVEGRVAANGDVSLNSYNIGLVLPLTLDYSLVSSGSIQWQDGSCSHGGIIGASLDIHRVGIAVGGSFYSSECCTDEDCSSCTDGATSTSPLDFVTINSYVSQLSSFWNSLSPNGAVTQNFNTLNLACEPNVSVNVFLVDSLADITEIAFQCDESQTIVINYSSSVNSLSGLGFTLGNANQTHIIHHFNGATLTISGVGVAGSVFAPNSVVYANGCVIYGNVVCGSFGDADQCNDGQINSVPFTGCAPVPNPTYLCCNYSKRVTYNGPIFQNAFCTPEATCESIPGWALEYASNVEDCSACCDC